MHQQQFWQIIEQTGQEASALARTPERQDQDLLDLHADRLRAHLSGRSPEQVREFYEQLTAAREQLNTWPVRDVAGLLLDGCTDDAFAAFTTWVVSRGAADHAAVRAHPDGVVNWVMRLPLQVPIVPAARFEQAAGALQARQAGAEIARLPRPLPSPTGERDDTRTLRELYPVTASAVLGPAQPWRQGAAHVLLAPGGPDDVWGTGPFDSDARLSALAQIAWEYAGCDAEGFVKPNGVPAAARAMVAEEIAEYLDRATWEPDSEFSWGWYSGAYAAAGLVAAVLHRYDQVPAETARTTRRGSQPWKDTSDVPGTDPLGLAHHFGYTALADRAHADQLRPAAADAVRQLLEQEAWLGRHEDQVGLRRALEALAGLLA